VDTSFWGGDPEPTLMSTVTNNSDRTFASLYIEKNIVVDGKIVKSNSTTYIFSNEQIVPMPKDGEDAHVKPGMSVFLSFDIPQTSEIQPEIASVGFVDEGEE
jgi:transcriptional/translational regulatory protein YebC/TACO1